MQFVQPGTQPARVSDPYEICRIAGHVDRHALLEHVERPAEHCVEDVRVVLAQQSPPLVEGIVEVGGGQLAHRVVPGVQLLNAFAAVAHAQAMLCDARLLDANHLRIDPPAIDANRQLLPRLVLAPPSRTRRAQQPHCDAIQLFGRHRSLVLPQLLRV